MPPETQPTKPMMSTQSLFAGYIIEKPKSIRQQLIDEALEKVNESRKGTKYKPVTARAIAIRVNTSCPEDIDCHYLLNACRRGNFSQIFWGATKAK